jgi:ribosomal protein S18 acetylase RimI-like enzyme
MTAPAPECSITVRPLTDADRAAVGEVYAAAFDDKTAALVGTHREAVAPIMAELLDGAPNSWVAETAGDGVVGVACVHDALLSGAHHRPWRVLRGHLPLGAALRGWFHMWLLHNVTVADDRLYLDALAVRPSVQCNGIGGALLETVVEEAARRGKAAVFLYVIDRNDRGAAFYRQHGFTARHSERLRWFAPIASFERTDYFERDIEGGAAARAAGAAAPPHRRLDVAGRLSSLFEAHVWRREPPLER